MTYISISARLLVDVEALNMVESVGNVTRHRRATIILDTPEGYRKVEVPAVSGEMIAHGYQESLVRVAEEIYGGNPPVCKWCKRGELFKEMDKKHMVEEAAKLEGEGEEYAHNFEVAVIKNCLVEDIGGFLKAERPPVRRTSRFQVGYMTPTKDAIQASSLESQFHVRHAPSEPARSEGERAAQMIYYVEVGSALYGLTFNLDLDGISYTSLVKRELAVTEEERSKRVRTALGALIDLFSGSGYGAKKTRFLPIIEVKSFTAALSHPMPFTTLPPTTKHYIEDTAKKVKTFTQAYSRVGVKERVKIYAFSTEVEVPKDPNVEQVKSLEEALNRIIEDVMGKA